MKLSSCIGALICFAAMSAASSVAAQDLKASVALCEASKQAFNTQFSTISSLSASGSIPEDSGFLAHTIHGIGTGGAEIHIDALNALSVEPNKTCGQFMNQKPPVFLPWCGSNKDPQSHQWSDASSWSYVRLDTLINSTATRRKDEVVCAADNNKRYGLIFSNAYMNEVDNLGCMYPLDGDTGGRVKMGCGISQNPIIDLTEAQGACPVGDKAAAYISDFDALLTDDGGAYASYAGSLICSLPKSEFDVWVDVRKQINLSRTDWPVNEFVLWNWDTYSTADLAKNGTLVGIYYLSGCSQTSSGNRGEAQQIADLYKEWSGVDLPVLNLSNADMRQKKAAPFSCQ